MDPAAKSVQPWALTLVEGLSEMRAEVLGARAWVDALFDRITRLEPRIRAWSHLDREGAVAAADRVDLLGRQAAPARDSRDEQVIDPHDLGVQPLAVARVEGLGRDHPQSLG